MLGSVLGGDGRCRRRPGDDTLGRMLGHLGGQQTQATQGPGRTGLGNDQTQMLLASLAPIVLAHLANHMFGGQQQAGVGAGGFRAAGFRPAGLGDVLGREVEMIGQQQGGLGGLLGQVLGGGGGGLADCSAASSAAAIAPDSIEPIHRIRNDKARSDAGFYKCGVVTIRPVRPLPAGRRSYQGPSRVEVAFTNPRCFVGNKVQSPRGGS